jgi:adenylyltransferase/sulfurtransferase
MIGMLQAIEAIKLILGLGDSLLGRLLHFDALKMKFREFHLRRDLECPVCGENPTISELQDYEQFCAGPRRAATSVPEMNALDLQLRRAAGENLTLLDVREPFEDEIARIDGRVLIPLGELPDRLAEIPRTTPVVVYCHSGVRSAHGAQLLRQAGVEQVYNLTGGIEAWSMEVDPAVPRY